MVLRTGKNGHNESCRIMNSQILILYAQMGTTTFYNPKKDLKALHLGTYPLHLYEIARGSSHEMLFFYSMGIQSYTSCPRPTKNPNPMQFFLYLGIHDLKLRSGRSRNCLSMPRLAFSARDWPSTPRPPFTACSCSSRF